MRVVGRSVISSNKFCCQGDILSEQRTLQCCMTHTALFGESNAV